MSFLNPRVQVCPGIVTLAILGFGSAAAVQAAPPNILFIMADQMRGDCLGADGNRVIRTPNLDRLAAEGARFRCAYSSTPSCTPARAAILTGLSPWRHGMLGYSSVAEKYPREMPALLRAAGYYTLGAGKMHYHPQRNLHGFHATILDESGREETPEFRSDYRCWFASMAPGMDPGLTGIGWNDYRGAVYALPEPLHPTVWTADVAVNFLKNYRQASPFLLKVSFARPHSPYDPPERFMRMYECGTGFQPVRTGKMPVPHQSDLPPAAIGDWEKRNDVPANPGDYSLWRGNLGPEAVRRTRQAYYGSVSFVDEQIGRVLKALEDRGWLDNTLILFTSDHGDMLGDHHLWRKTYAYEGSARIPMLVRWPKSLPAPRGAALDQPVELRDILPTFLDAAGAKYNEMDFDGRSLLQLVRGDTRDWRSWIDLEHAQCYSPDNGWTALTDGRVKYIYHAAFDEEQLFDLREDPHELHDLAARPQHKSLLESWRGHMVQHLSERGEAFVKDGKLVPRRPNLLLSPNYPQEQPTSAPAAPRGRRKGPPPAKP